MELAFQACLIANILKIKKNNSLETPLKIPGVIFFKSLFSIIYYELIIFYPQSFPKEEINL